MSVTVKGERYPDIEWVKYLIAFLIHGSKLPKDQLHYGNFVIGLRSLFRGRHALFGGRMNGQLNEFYEYSYVLSDQLKPVVGNQPTKQPMALNDSESVIKSVEYNFIYHRSKDRWDLDTSEIRQDIDLIFISNYRASCDISIINSNGRLCCISNPLRDCPKGT